MTRKANHAAEDRERAASVAEASVQAVGPVAGNGPGVAAENARAEVFGGRAQAVADPGRVGLRGQGLVAKHPPRVRFICWTQATRRRTALLSSRCASRSASATALLRRSRKELKKETS